MKQLTPWVALATLLFAFNVSFLKAENTINYGFINLAKTELSPMSSIETSQVSVSIPEVELAMLSSAEAAETASSDALLDRLNEINEMDISAMSLSEKNELRKEVRAIEKEKRPSGGIYLSVGAAILIALILILLL